MFHEKEKKNVLSLGMLHKRESNPAPNPTLFLELENS
jgi:hypothetical protein